jgi:5-methylcytosine-specific restriction endonuclease McrA
LALGIDPGTGTTGITVRTENGTILFASELGLRSKQVTENMTERRMHRRSRRNYRRLRRIRRAKKAKTRFEAKQYRIVGVKDPLKCKEIRPKLSKFWSRKRKEGWLTPTAGHLLESHENYVKKISQTLPIKKVGLEYAQFDMHKLAKPDVKGKEYQEGRMKGFANAREYVLQRDRHTCQLCKKSQRELHVHHVLWKEEGGADVPENLLTLCKQCHDKVHKDTELNSQVKELFEAMEKRYVHPTLLNTIMPAFHAWLCKEFREVKVGYGYEARELREKYGLKKEHYVDAYIASFDREGMQESQRQSLKEKIERCVVHEFQQFRRHNRQLIHARRDRNYYAGTREYESTGDHGGTRDHKGTGDHGAKNKIVAKNRHKRMGQTGDSLAEYTAQKGQQCLGKLRVTKGQKMIRSKKEKFKPGDVVLREDGTQRIVRGSGHNGYSVTLLFEKKYEIASKCRLLAKNKGIVCVNEKT